MLWRKPAGPMCSGVRVAMAACMGWSMAGGSSAISAVPAATRPPSRPARSCRPTKAADKLLPGLLSYRPGKTGISSLELSRHLGVNYDTAWLLHNKILRAMT